MAVTAKMYGLFMKSLANKEIDLDSDSLKVMLCTNAYTPNQDTDQYKAAVTNEISGTGYTATGQALTSVAVAYNAGTNTFNLDSADPSWTGASFTARYAVFYDATPATDSIRPLISYVDFGADVTVTASTFTLTLDALGIVGITTA